MRRYSFVIFGLALGMVSLTAHRPAEAGAWTHKPGEGQVIVTAGRNMAPIGRFISGEPSADSTLSQIYLEYGLYEGLTIGGSAFVEIADENNVDNGSAFMAFFVRRRLWQSDAGDVVSAELGYAHPIEPLIGEDFGDNNPDSVPELRLRGQYGRGFWGDWGNAFVSVDAGYDWRGEGEPDEVRLDVSGGYAPLACCMGILSVFTTVPLSDQQDTQVKLAPSFAYTFGTARDDGEDSGKGLTVQLGVSQDLMNFEDGFGVEVSFWKPF